MHSKKISFLKFCDDLFLRSLAEKSKLLILKKGEVVIKEGDVAYDMFLVIQGQVLVGSQNFESIFDTISKGGYFGEVGVLKGLKRTASVVVTSDIAALVVLSGESLKEVIAMYPDSSDLLVHSYDERLDKAQKRAEIKKLEKGGSKFDLQVIDPIPTELLVDAPLMSLKSMSKFWNSGELSVSKRNSSNRRFTLSNPDTKHLPVTNITQLSLAELHVVLKLVTLKDLFKIMQTCSHFMKLATRSSFWDTLDLKPLSLLVSRRMIQYIPKTIWSFVINLNLATCNQVDDVSLTILSAHCKAIKILNLSGCWKITDKGVGLIAHKLTSLTSLNISNCKKITGKSFEQHNLENLGFVDLSFCPFFTESGLESLIASAPDLSAIVMKRTLLLGDFALFLIARYCHDLTFLDISDGMHFSDRYIRLLFLSCPKISNLSLKFCKNISATGFKAITNSNLPLRVLDISYCNSVTNSTIINFKDSIQNLEKLNVRGCKNLNNRIGPVLKNFAPFLKELDIRGCPNLSLIVLQEWIVKAKILSDDKPKTNSEPLEPLNSIIEVKQKDARQLGGKRKNKAIKTILDLSPGELQIVFKRVSSKRILYLTQVCKTMRDLIKTPYFWTVIDFKRQFHYLNGKMLQNFISLAGNYLRVLDISMCSYLVDADLALAAQNCINVQTLILTNCWRLTDRSLAVISQRLTGLRSLNISHCPKINGSGFHDHKLLKLESFNGSYCRNLNTAGILNLVARAQKIKTIVFRRCEGVTNRTVAAIAQHCVHLESIDLADGIQFTEGAVSRLVLNCKNLRSVNLRFCSGISDRGFSLISLAKLKYEKLDFSFCPNLTEDVMLNFRHNLLGLEYLSLQNCGNISEAVLLHISAYCPRLKYLNLRGCKQLNRKMIESIFFTRNIHIELSDPPENRGVLRPNKDIIIEYKDVARNNSISRLHDNNQVSIRKLAENSILKYSKSEENLKILKTVILEKPLTAMAEVSHAKQSSTSPEVLHGSDETLGPRPTRISKKRTSFRDRLNKVLSRFKSKRSHRTAKLET